MTNEVFEWDGPVCWNEFDSCADDVEQAAQDIADQLVDWSDDWKFTVYCCVKGEPVVGDYAEEVIEWIDNIEENNLACGDGLIAREVTEDAKERLNQLIKDWVKSLNISMYRWAPGNPEMDITKLVKAAYQAANIIQEAAWKQ